MYNTLVPLALGLLYAYLVAAHRGESKGGLGSLAALFSNPWLLLAGWIHYLAFDLFIGSWEVRDEHAHNVQAVVKFLIVTFLFYYISRFERMRTHQLL